MAGSSDERAGTITATMVLWRWTLAGAALLAAGVLAFAWIQLPAIGAVGLLHPSRRAVASRRPAACDDATVESDGLTFRGWHCQASGTRRATLIYLHGIADNRTSAIGAVDRFVNRGFDVIAFDSRAHGDSDGNTCTYGFYERHDLHRIVDTAAAGPIVLMGTSLGAAVALQEAADDPRVTAVVAAETFSDLRTVATERAPWFFSRTIIDHAFRIAEAQGRFRVDAVSPVIAAARIACPVLLIHGAHDVDTRPEHSARVLGALRGAKRLILVPDAGHNQSLQGEVWDEIERWLDGVLASRPADVISPGVVARESKYGSSVSS